MIDNEYHKEIKRDVRRLAKDQIKDEKKLHIYERPQGHHTISATPGKTLADLYTIKPMKGGNYAEVEDTRRVELERAMGSGKPKAQVETVYKKQMPILGGSNGPNMEMIDERELIKKGAGEILLPKSVPKNTYGRIPSADIKGGEVLSDICGVLGDKLKKGSKKKKEGGSWTHAVKEIIEDKPVPPTQSTPSGVIVGAGVSRRTARTDKIKEIMKSQGINMISASKYIKEHNISY